MKNYYPNYNIYFKPIFLTYNKVVKKIRTKKFEKLYEITKLIMKIMKLENYTP